MFTVYKHIWDSWLYEVLVTYGVSIGDVTRGDDPGPIDDFGGWLMQRLLPGMSILSGYVGFTTPDVDLAKSVMDLYNVWYLERDPTPDPKSPLRRVVEQVFG